MPRPWRIRFAGAKYHVTVRGNAREVIFHAPEDYVRFLEQLASALERDEVLLYAYVLMPNHAHLLVETPLGNISRFMQRLNTAYGMYRRYKRHRPGHCFQARYGAKLVSGDSYLLRVTRYVHLNPVKVKALAGATTASKVAHLNAYPWSSYGAYIGNVVADVPVDLRWLMLMERKTEQARRSAYRAYVESLVDGDDRELREATEASRYAVGDAAFREDIEASLREVRVAKAVAGDILWPVGRQPPVARVLALVAAEFGLTVESLRGHGRRVGIAKQVAAELASRYSGVSQREVGRALGYRGNGAVGKQRARLRETVAADHALARRMDQLKQRLAQA